MIRGEHGIQCMPCSSLITRELLPELYTMENFDFGKSLFHSQIFQFSVFSVMCGLSV